MNIKFPKNEAAIANSQKVLEVIVNFLNAAHLRGFNGEDLKPSSPARLVASGIGVTYELLDRKCSVSLEIDTLFTGECMLIRFLVTANAGHLDMQQATEFHDVYGKLIKLALTARDVGESWKQGGE